MNMIPFRLKVWLAHRSKFLDQYFGHQIQKEFKKNMERLGKSVDLGTAHITFINREKG